MVNSSVADRRGKARESADSPSANSGRSSRALSSSSSSGVRTRLRSSVGVAVTSRKLAGNTMPKSSVKPMPAAWVSTSQPVVVEYWTGTGAQIHAMVSASSSVSAAGSLASAAASALSGAMSTPVQKL